MTRAQAIAAVNVANDTGQRVANDTGQPVKPGGMMLVDALAALGLLRLEEPTPFPTHVIPILSYQPTKTNMAALVYEITLVETLRAVGYDVRKR